MKVGQKYKERTISVDEDIWNEIVNSFLNFERKMKLFARLKKDGNLHYYQLPLDCFMEENKDVKE